MWSFWENENFQQLQQVLVWEICTLSNWYIQYNNTFESIISLYSSVSYQLLVLSHCFKPLHTCYLLYHNSPTYISAGWWQSGRFGYSRHPGTYSSIRFAVLKSPIIILLIEGKSFAHNLGIGATFVSYDGLKKRGNDMRGLFSFTTTRCSTLWYLSLLHTCKIRSHEFHPPVSHCQLKGDMTEESHLLSHHYEVCEPYWTPKSDWYTDTEKTCVFVGIGLCDQTLWTILGSNVNTNEKTA